MTPTMLTMAWEVRILACAEDDKEEMHTFVQRVRVEADSAPQAETLALARIWKLFGVEPLEVLDSTVIANPRMVW